MRGRSDGTKENNESKKMVRIDCSSADCDDAGRLWFCSTGRVCGA